MLSDNQLSPPNLPESKDMIEEDAPSRKNFGPWMIVPSRKKFGPHSKQPMKGLQARPKKDTKSSLKDTGPSDQWSKTPGFNARK